MCQQQMQHNSWVFFCWNIYVLYREIDLQCINLFALLPKCVLRDSRTYLEELNTNTGKHELQQRGDDDDIPNGADGYKHTLDHMLWTQIKLSIKINVHHIYHNTWKALVRVIWTVFCANFLWIKKRETHFEALGSVDCSQGPQYPQHSENLHYINGTWPVNHSAQFSTTNQTG